MTRRKFLYMGGAALLAAACGNGAGPATTLAGPGTTAAAGTTAAPGTTAPGTTGAPATTGAAGEEPAVNFVEPRQSLSGELNILLWSHFVPAHDTWFDPFVQEWGDQVGVTVNVDHIAVADVPAAIAAEIQSGQPEHDLMQYIAVLSQHEPSVVDMSDVVAEAESRYGTMLDLTRRSSFNPNTEKFYAYAPSWVPDPGDYRRSLWEAVGMPDGPRTYDDLLAGGAEIFASQGVQLGIGMSQEIDSNMALRGLLWSFGAGIQDENENVIINSDATIAAVEYMNELFSNAMTPEVFAWNAASNNQGINAGELSYILNSISAYRTAQDEGLDVADDIWFTPALEGPATAIVASHVMYNWIIPDAPDVNVAAAQEFLLHYTENLAPVAWHSKLYDFPAFPDRVPQLDGWLDNDPFGSNPADKLSVLKTSLDWATNIGHPGPANPAIGQIFGESIIPVMFAEAAQGTKTPAEAVADAEAQINAIFDDWRGRGLVGSG
ncbi:MAG TPA: extracellular solute-binding protein [Acidimicrobiia bacterium]|nr:extracellular solute-binding protein [Acidimicrobiia bacterium]